MPERTDRWPDTAATRLDDAITRFIAAGGAPGAVAVVGDTTQARTLTKGVVAPGYAEVTPTAAETRYDVASLTKIMTWFLTGTAVAEGDLELDKPVSTYLGPSSHPGSGLTIRQMLSHTTGLRSATRFDEYLGTGTPLVEHILREQLETQPGESLRYINRGFILLGIVLERITGQSLDALAAERIWRPWKMDRTSYGPLPANEHVAPTERRLVGTRPTWGVVHDESTALMGGVAGHAGVFSTAVDMVRFAEGVLATGREESALGAYVRDSFEVHAAQDGTRRGLGWIVAPEPGVAYHHGFTGTSLYLAPKKERFMVVLTNAVFVSRDRRKLKVLRTEALKAMSDMD
nr:serine hydrolase domain-containing protein [Kibdelosporangium sp. MJ126-NF4]CEL16992.1 Beta-lactamase class C and other penicillin binding proteins [Kibdelosporangium sp. MJ126-NF4]CTQ91779.1 Beta-lactamase class C and other penicillin binding proteins [Kibdelosporangium sp. MJ126-NF4]